VWLPDSKGMTPLHKATFMVIDGPLINANRKDKKAIISLWEKKEKLVDLLLSHNSELKMNVDVVDRTGNLALHYFLLNSNRYLGLSGKAAHSSIFIDSIKRLFTKGINRSFASHNSRLNQFSK
jgi:hypothetical protein